MLASERTERRMLRTRNASFQGNALLAPGVALPREYSKRVPWRTSAAVGLSLLTGLYFPTSIDGAISKPLLGAFCAAAGVMFALILARRQATLPSRFLVNAAIINGLMLLFTATTPLDRVTYVTLVTFALLSVLLCVKLRDIPLTAMGGHLWLLINVVTLAGAVLTLLSNATIIGLLVRFYSSHSPELLERMLSLHKPVLTLGSHSIASFFCYLFFGCALRTYRARLSMKWLVIAVAHLAMCAFLFCVSSYILAGIGLIELTVTLCRSRLTSFITVTLIVLVFAWLALDSQVPQDIASQVADTFASDGNGFQARYTSTGVLASTINFILANPFRPVGAGYSDTLWFGDSGLVELWLRGSIFLTIAVYAGYWGFLKNNLHNRSTARWLFATMFGFEIAYGGLLYLRTMCVLPFIIVYLNDLERTPKRRQLPGTGTA